MLACLLRADGWEVVYLGQCTPVADAVALADSREASVLAFSVTMPENGEALVREFGALLPAAKPSVATVIGGAAASAGLAKRIGAAYVGSDLAKAVPALRPTAP